MEIKKNMAYIADDEATYLCIGFTDNKEHAILAPFWADDEGETPDIQDDPYLVVQNPFHGGYLKELIGLNLDGKVRVKIEFDDSVFCKRRVG